MPLTTPGAVSQAVARLVPQILRGVQLDFFVRRRVTQSQFLLLLAIHAHARCPMGTLARSLHVSMPTTTGIVNRLVRDGYVRRCPAPEDRRQVIVELTTKGRTFISDFQAVVRHRWHNVLKALSPGELTAFHQVITKLHGQLRLAT